MSRLLVRTAGVVGCALAVAASVLGALAYRMLPAVDGTVPLAGLTTAVAADFDEFGVPFIHAGDRLDAYRALGFITARDRLFQMDLLRRSSAGRLAEIMGESLLDADIQHRVWGFHRVARRVVERLPPDQLHVIESYAAGVNAWIDQVAVLPFEFQLLGYRPEPWTAEDCVLVVLGVFEGLDLNESEERMLTVMERALPPDVVAFLTPRRDPYRSRLSPRDPAYLAPEASPLPIDGLQSAVTSRVPLARADASFRFDRPRPGSNAWAVNGARTSDGRAILANDMHLGLSVPTLWYRYALQFGDQTVAGIGLPGTPLLVAGTNGDLAWGLTALGADVLDLVVLEIDPQAPDRYRTPDGWTRFDTHTETVGVRDGADREVTIRDSIWGPVSERALLGRRVAYRWTALDPDAVDLGLLALDRVHGLSAAIDIVNRSGGPPLNVVVAEQTGRVAWTMMGRIPVRRGFDGASSRSWADGAVGWDRYLVGVQLPRIIDPPSGFVVSANDQPYPESYPYPIGHGFDSGYRAFRIKQLLAGGEAFTEAGMLALQLDTRTEHYEFYRQLALAAVSVIGVPGDALRRNVESVLLAWEGRAEVDTIGLGLLVEFRKRLLDAVLGPVLRPCRELDPDFDFAWPHVDAPLQRLLTERPSGILPGIAWPGDWDRFVSTQLQASVEALQQRHHVSSLAKLPWGRINTTRIAHPFSAGLSWLAPLLDLPAQPQPGCEFCVRFAVDEVGATERLVVAPGHIGEGILHLPGGQSGQPQSVHYRDQYPHWLTGSPISLISKRTHHTLHLVGTARTSRPGS